MSELLWPPLTLRCSTASTTNPRVLYSASIAEQLGTKDDRQGVYVDPRTMPWTELPESMEMMVWDSEPDLATWDVVEELQFHSGHDRSQRYDATRRPSTVQSVYLAKAIFRGAPPATCFVGLRPAPARPPSGWRAAEA